MKKHSIVTLTLMIFTFAMTTVAMAGDDSLVGTWKLNVAKSKYPPGTAPKNETIKNKAQENGVKQVFAGVSADGKPIHIVFSIKYDSKDYPVTGSPSIDTMAYTRIDANTINLVQKKSGKEVLSGQIVISKDGKTATVTEKGKDAKGKEITIVEVADKQ